VLVLPESESHAALKQILVKALKRWYGASINEYPSSGHELDVFAVTPSGISIYVEIIWSPSKMQFLSDINLLQQSDADVKMVVANPEIIANQKMTREFAKVVVSQRRRRKLIHDSLFDGQKILGDSDYVEHDFRGIVEQLVTMAGKTKLQRTISGPISKGSEEPKSVSSFSKSNRLLPISSFKLPDEVKGWCGKDTVAFIMYWQDSEPWMDIWYETDPTLELGMDLSGGQISLDVFVSLLKLNPEIRGFEFGLTGKPKSVLIGLFEGEKISGYVGSYELGDSIRGRQSDSIKKIIKALV